MVENECASHRKGFDGMEFTASAGILAMRNASVNRHFHLHNLIPRSCPQTCLRCRARFCRGASELGQSNLRRARSGAGEGIETPHDQHGTADLSEFRSHDAQVWKRRLLDEIR